MCFCFLPGNLLYSGCGVVGSSQAAASSGSFNASLCLAVCVSKGFYVNPGGQVYNKTGMRLRPFCNDRPTKSHSTSFALLNLLLSWFPPMILSISSLLPVCVPEEKAILNDRARKTRMFLFLPVLPPFHPIFTPPSFCLFIADFSLVGPHSPFILSSEYENQRNGF